MVPISEEVVKSHLQGHPFYPRLLHKNGPNSLVDWKYHDIVDVNSGTIVKIKAWVNAKRKTFSERGVPELAERMRAGKFFWSDVVYVFDFLLQEEQYVMAYKFRWNVDSQNYDIIMRGAGY